MADKKQRKPGVVKPTSAKASITFPEEVYSEHERINRSERVSVASFVRDAVDKYVADKYPIFAKT